MGPNLGGASTVNVWSPLLIPATLLSSASQQWYSTGIVPFVDFQSVECGWRAGVIDGAPADSLPRLFVYYTKKDYLSGQSYYDDYNLTGGFAYTPGASHALHAALSPVSTQGGTQYDIRMGFSLTGGRWWFHHAGTWIGSYAAAEFAPGTLAVSAADASFGGETTTGFGTFPVMGSGRFPAEGFGRAAHQRSVGVNDLTGVPRIAQLSPGQISPACYNVAITNNSGPDWGSYVYFGGPGGLNCPDAHWWTLGVDRRMRLVCTLAVDGVLRRVPFGILPVDLRHGYQPCPRATSIRSPPRNCETR